MRRKTMKIMLFAAAAALTFGIGAALADSGGGEAGLPQYRQAQIQQQTQLADSGGGEALIHNA
jgi:hypothetical protein